MIRYSLLTALFFATATTAMAEDLPNNELITNRSTDVTIYDVKDAKITHDQTQVDAANGHRVVKVQAALELSLNVEGNLCDSSAADVFVRMNRNDAGDTLLSIARRYGADPFSGILTGCLAYSAPRDVTVAVEIYDYAFDTDFEQTISVVIGNAPQSFVQVLVSYNETDGLTATVIR